MNNTIQKSKPLISVITVVRDGAAHLEQTILSVLQQPYENLEYIIIDGGSTDGTVDIIRKHEKKLSCWISEKDHGIYDAMNKGWSLAKDNGFIIFLGAGDRLLSLPDAMETYQANEVICGRVFLNDNLVFNPRTGCQLRIYNTLHHQALLINKGLHPAKPFDTRYKIYADFDFNQRLYKMGAKFLYSESFRAYASPSGTSSRFNLAETLQIVIKNFGTLWGIITLSAFLAVKMLPRMKRLRPITRRSPKDDESRLH